MTNNRLNVLAMLYVHPVICHPPSEEALQRYVALGPHWMEFD